ncbi:MAG: metallophosphoesterase, partial [Candidatus Hodarchaeales archaeon]
DLESEIITNCVMVQDSNSFSGYRNIIRDSVVAISGVLPKNFTGGAVTAFWGKDIIRPGFKTIKFKQSSHSNKILFISDIHFGSKSFSQNIFARLIKFLTLQDLSSDYKNVAEEISSIIIAGDLVEGIGNFSDEKDQLLLHSINAQYEGLGTLLKEIPEHIQIIIIPGEHDATQAALPQPEIEKQIGKSLTGLPNVRSGGNPLRLSIDELNLLVFHGQGNETLFQEQNSEDLILGIQHLLEYRHLCPEYGSFTPLAPFKKDYLVINEIPDVFVLGHFHQAHFSEYKGVKIITCGSFKRAIQKSQKIKKDPSIGKIPILDTLTGRVEILDLKSI